MLSIDDLDGSVLGARVNHVEQLGDDFRIPASPPRRLDPTNRELKEQLRPPRVIPLLDSFHDLPVDHLKVIYCEASELSSNPLMRGGTFHDGGAGALDLHVRLGIEQLGQSMTRGGLEAPIPQPTDYIVVGTLAIIAIKRQEIDELFDGGSHLAQAIPR